MISSVHTNPMFTIHLFWFHFNIYMSLDFVHLARSDTAVTNCVITRLNVRSDIEIYMEHDNKSKFLNLSDIGMFNGFTCCTVKEYLSKQ